MTMQQRKTEIANPGIIALAQVTHRAAPRRAKSIKRNPMLYKPKPKHDEPDVRERRIEKILADRRERNERNWLQFKARRWDIAWEYLHGRPCEKPDLELEPSVFREILGMVNSSQDELHTELQFQVARKLAQEGA